MNKWALLFLAPILLYQGHRVKKSTLRLAEPPGERYGTSGTAEPLSLLIVGDSAAVGVGCGRQEDALSGQLVNLLARERQVNWQLIGRSSLTCEDILALLKSSRLKLDRVDTVLISAGVNDVTKHTSVKNWNRALAELTGYLQQRLKAKQIIYTALPPMHQFPALPQPLRWYIGQQAKELDNALKQHCTAHEGVTYLPLDLRFNPELMARDGFHPSSKAARIWAEQASVLIR